jgi:DNA-binding SARP family transcriptional activator/tetratricopeptide (TPR) repeat protein
MAEMGCLEFRVLGPVEAVQDGAPIALGRGILVDLLATLLVSANRAVSADDLVDIVWHARPPAHPRAALHNGISRLRRLIGEDPIETLARGYRLRADADHLDVLRLDELVGAAGQAVSAEDAERSLALALELWRGRPLGNVESPVLLNTAAQQLTNRLLDACERWAELCLGMGRYDAVTSRLAAVVEAHPFREQLAGQLMMAMYRSGRRADALAAYESVRQVLAGELGVDPGPAIQDLHLKILRDDPSLTADASAGAGASSEGGRPGTAGDCGSAPAVPRQFPPAVPRQLPPDVPDFCGRDAETSVLADAVTGTGTDAAGETRIAAVSGTGGVGKTALAVRVAHRLAGEFGDGQLFADLRGVSGAPARPCEVLAGFLRALGVDGSAVPRLLSDRIVMYRSLVADRRLLIVLDNAEGESQVRPLLPASASCAVIVTSRARMTGLAGAGCVHLSTLGEDCAVDLLGRIIGHDRARREVSDVKALAGLCGGLPLALRIAGARLAARPHWPVAKLAGRMADTRRGLSELVHGDLDVRASFALSYQSLDPQAKAMLRRVSLLAAPDFPAWTGAAVLDVSTTEAEDTCERLVDAQLLEAQPSGAGPGGPGEIRYRVHDLVRAFAHERTVAEEPEAVQSAALARAFGGLLALAEHAHRRVVGGDFTILHGCAPRWRGSGQAVRHAIDADPIGWLDGERRAIAAAVRQSADLGLDELSWDLAWTAVTLYETRAYFDDRIATQKHALAAAVKADNRRGRAAMLAAQSSTALMMGSLSEVRELAEESLRLFTEIGDTHGRANALYRLGMFYTKTGESKTAISRCQEAIPAGRLAGDSVLGAMLLRELAVASLQCKEQEAASDYAIRSLRILEETGSPRKAFSLLQHVLGEIYLRRGQPDMAEVMLRRVLADVQADNDIVGQAHVLLSLGETLGIADRGGEADRYLRASLALARQGRLHVVEARALFVLGTLNPAGHPMAVRRNQLSRSLAIFAEHCIPHWRQRTAAALNELGEWHDTAWAEEPPEADRENEMAVP